MHTDSLRTHLFARSGLFHQKLYLCLRGVDLGFFGAFVEASLQVPENLSHLSESLGGKENRGTETRRHLGKEVERVMKVGCRRRWYCEEEAVNVSNLRDFHEIASWIGARVEVDHLKK